MARRPIYEPFNLLDVNAAAGPGVPRNVRIYQLSGGSLQWTLTSGQYQLEASNDGDVYLPLGGVVSTNSFYLFDANYTFIRVTTVVPGDAVATLQIVEYTW